MAGMMMSNFMMFLPEMTRWICLIGLAVFIFGIYIPYDKYKQRKRKQIKKTVPKPSKQMPVKKPIDRKQVQQLDILKEAGLLTKEEYQERLSKL